MLAARPTPAPHGAPVLPRIRLVLWLLVAGYVAFIAWTYHQGFQAAARGAQPMWTDFTHTYGSSLLVRYEPAENLYYPRRMAEATRLAADAAYGYSLAPEQSRLIGYPPWMYPPPFILVVIPLAYLPYLPALLAWLALTAAPFLAAMRTILPVGGSALFALAAPPTFYNLMYGQTGFLTGGLIGLGLALLGRRPVLAGVLIGLASVKPHFGVLIPLALLAGAHWRAFWAATLTVFAMIVISILSLGMDPWYGFIGTFLFSLEGFGAGAYAWDVMTSVLSTAHLAGLGLEGAWRVQYAVAAMVAVVVAGVWWHGRGRPDTLGLQAAVLCAGTPLAVPMVYVYDLVLVVPAAAWIWADMRRRGGSGGETATLVLALAGMLPLYLLASRVGIQVGALCVALLFGLALYRYLRSPVELSGPARRAPESA